MSLIRFLFFLLIQFTKHPERAPKKKARTRAQERERFPPLRCALKNE